jgi:hypothetical protein
LYLLAFGLGHRQITNVTYNVVAKLAVSGGSSGGNSTHAGKEGGVNPLIFSFLRDSLVSVQASDHLVAVLYVVGDLHVHAYKLYPVLKVPRPSVHPSFPQAFPFLILMALTVDSRNGEGPWRDVAPGKRNPPYPDAADIPRLILLGLTGMFGNQFLFIYGL